MQRRYIKQILEESDGLIPGFAVADKPEGVGKPEWVEERFAPPSTFIFPLSNFDLTTASLDSG